MVVESCEEGDSGIFHLVNFDDQREIYLININDQRISLFTSVCVQCSYKENATLCASLQILNDIDQFQVQLNLNTNLAGYL